MLTKLLEFVKQAGEQMIKMRGNLCDVHLKEENVSSVVTNTDILISDMFKEFLQKHFSSLNYIIIDEEKINEYHDDIFAAIKNSDYQFVIDPIDGTIQYANSHPLYGISIGVYEQGKPLTGIIYLPELQELLYTDGQQVCYIKHAFTDNELKQNILSQQNVSAPILFWNALMWQFTEQYSANECIFINYFSAVSQSLYTLIGQAKGYCMQLSLWDIAGTMPIAMALGMQIISYDDGTKCDKISSQYFTAQMFLKKPSILCYPRYFSAIKKIVEPRKH